MRYLAIAVLAAGPSLWGSPSGLQARFRAARRTEARLHAQSLAPLFIRQSQAEAARLAEQAMAEERYPDAIRLYTELLKSDPGNSGYRMNLGLAFHSTGDYAKAARHFEIVLREKPEYAPASLLLGLTYVKMGEPAKAVRPLELALADDPANYAARFELAGALRRSSRFEEAASHYFTLVQRNPNFTPAWQGLVLCYDALARAIPPVKFEPEASDPAGAEVSEGRYWQAVAALKGDDSPRARYWRKQAYEGLAARAMANFAELPPSGDSHELLAEILAQQGKLPEAIEEWRQALELSPDSQEVNRGLGEALAKSGKTAEARPYLEKAAKLRGGPGSGRK